MHVYYARFMYFKSSRVPPASSPASMSISRGMQPVTVMYSYRASLPCMILFVLSLSPSHFLFQDKWVELRKEYVGFLMGGRLYIFRTGVFLPPNTSYGERVSERGE